MGNKFSKKSDNSIKSILYLDSEKKKKIKLKVVNLVNHNQTSYVFFKPAKKINYMKYPNICMEIQDTTPIPKNSKIHDFELWNSLILEEDNSHKIFEAAFNIRQNLNPNQVGDKKFLEKHIVNTINNYSIKVRINSKNNLLEEIIFILPSSELQKIEII